MNISKIVFLFSVCIVTACSSTSNKPAAVNVAVLDTTNLKPGAEFYQCPMHPEVISEKAGDCPKCGMALEKVIKQ